MEQSTILVVDDEKIWRNLLSRLLRTANYEVHTATGCADGIRLAELHKPDCILLDFHLTDGTAADVCLSVRSREDIKKTPIIIFSSDPDKEIISYAQCRADKFVLKGIPLTKLLAVIEILIRKTPQGQASFIS